MLDVSMMLDSRYVNGGRDYPEWDCWGLVRYAFYELNGVELPLLNSLDADSLLGKTKAHKMITKSLVLSEPKAGVIAAVMVGLACEHVGIVVDYNDCLMVIDTTPHTGPRMLTLDEFKGEYETIEYYAPA